MTLVSWIRDKAHALNVYARLHDLETFVQTQTEKTMAQIDDLQAANARIVKVALALGQTATDQRKIIDELRAELSAVKGQTLAPDAVQAIIESANAAAEAGENALAGVAA